jgi:hypothetical protein
MSRKTKPPLRGRGVREVNVTSGRGDPRAEPSATVPPISRTTRTEREGTSSGERPRRPGAQPIACPPTLPAPSDPELAEVLATAHDERSGRLLRPTAKEGLRAAAKARAAELEETLARRDELIAELQGKLREAAPLCEALVEARREITALEQALRVERKEKAALVEAMVQQKRALDDAAKRGSS